MCGLVGMAKHVAVKSQDEEKVFADLLIMDTLRGLDSTGVGFAAPDARSMLFKRAVPGWDFVFSTLYQRQVLKKMNAHNVIIGHNRAATKGAVDDLTAHPFIVDHILMAHNGHVWNHDKLGVERPEPYIDVDSYDVACSLAQNGELETLKKLKGSYQLVWWNEQDDTLNFAGNGDRSFTWILAQNGTMFWASEMYMLYHALSRHNIKTGSKFYVPTKNALYKFKVSDLTKYERIPYEPEAETHTSKGGAAGASPFGGTKVIGGGTSGSGTTTTSGGTSQTSTTTNIEQKLDEEKINRLIEEASRQSGGRFPHLPSSRRKIAKLVRKLDALGERYLGIRIVSPDYFAVYKGQETNETPKGVVIGSKYGGGAAELVEVHNVTQQQFDSCSRDGRMYVNITGVRNYDKRQTKDPILVGMYNHEQQAKYRKSFYKAYDGVLQNPHVEGDDEMAWVELNGTGPTVHVSPERFKAMTKDGCCNCSGYINPMFSDKLLWKGNAVLCHECATQPDIVVDLGFDTRAA